MHQLEMPQVVGPHGRLMSTLLGDTLDDDAYARYVLHDARSQWSLTELTERALARDEDAWTQLCGRLKNVVWKTVNSFGLSRHDAEDVAAAAFLRLFENLAKVRDPEFLPGWIARTARNEALTLVRTRNRTVPSDAIEPRTEAVEPAERMLDDELLAAVLAAFRHLSERCQQLLRLATAEPQLGYDVIAELLGRPRGAIGPTRGRCLDELRNRPEVGPFLAVGT